MGAEIAGGGPEMDVPATPVEAGDVLPDLYAGKALMHFTWAILGLRRSAAKPGKPSESQRYIGVTVGAEPVSDFTADTANPDPAAGLIWLGIVGRRDEGAALLSLKGGAEVAQCAGESARCRSRSRSGRCQKRAKKWAEKTGLS